MLGYSAREIEVKFYLRFSARGYGVEIYDMEGFLGSEHEGTCFKYAFEIPAVYEEQSRSPALGI